MSKSLQIQNPDLFAQLSSQFVPSLDPRLSPLIIPTALAHPGCAALYSMGSSDEVGNQYDLSGQGRTLLAKGTPTYNTNHLMSYVTLNGSTDCLFRATEPGLDIIGNEPSIDPALNGLTAFVWVRPKIANQNSVMFSKWGAAGYSYFLGHIGTAYYFYITPNNATFFFTTVGIAIANGWAYVACRFIPNTSLDIWVASMQSGVFTIENATNITGIPATLFNGTTGFSIGSANNAGNYYNGDISYSGLYRAALPTSRILMNLHTSRAVFNVL